MIDKTQELTNQVNELHAAIDALPDVKNIEINITGTAVEAITAIKADLDSLDDRTVVVNIVYKNIGGPDQLKEATQFVQQVVLPGNDTVKQQEQVIQQVDQSSGDAAGFDQASAAAHELDDELQGLRKEYADLAIQSGITRDEAIRDFDAVVETMRELGSTADEINQAITEENAKLSDSINRINDDTIEEGDSFGRLTEQIKEAQAGIFSYGASTDDSTAKNIIFSDSMRDVGIAADAAAGSGGGGGGLRGLAAAAGDAGDNARSGAIGWGLWGLALTGTIGHIGLWHIALDGAVEALIAVGLASVAFTIGLAAVASTAIDVKNHIQAVNEVNSALGDQIPVLGGDFRNFAESVGNSSKVLEIYGGAINAVSGQTGILSRVGSQVVTMFDDWIAKVDVWVQSQGTFGKVLESGVGFLHQFGTIFGEVAQAIDNLVKSDPGTAHFLLDIFEAAGKVLDVITGLPQPLLEVALGLHSLYVWGNFASGALGAILKFVPGMESLAAVFSRGFGLSDLLGPLGLVVGAIGAVVYEWYHLNDAAKSTVDNMLSELNQLSASQAILQVSADIGTLQTKMNQAFSPSNLQQITNGWKSVGGTLGAFGDYAINAGHNISKLNSDIDASHYESTFKDLGHLIVGFFTNTQTAATEAGQQWAIYNEGINKLLGSEKNLFTVMGDLTNGSDKFGVATHNVSQSLALMDLAGVQAGDSLAVMLQKVNNLVTGYQAMSVQGGILNGAVQAVTFSTELQQSKVTALTSAYSQWFSTLTGGISGFDAFWQNMQKLDQSFNLGTKNLGGFTSGQIAASAQFIQTAQSAQTQFNSLLTLASAAGLGAKGTGMLTQAMKDMVAVQLPAAKGNTRLQTTLLGLVQEVDPGITSFKQLSQWVGNTKDPMQNLDKITTIFTADAGNLTADVKNLATALHQDLNSAMAQVILTESGGLKPMENFYQAIATTGVNSETTRTDALKLAQQFVSLTGNVGDAKSEFVTFAESALNLTQAQADNLWAEISGKLTPAVNNNKDAVGKNGAAMDAWKDDHIGPAQAAIDTIKAHTDEFGQHLDPGLTNSIDTTASRMDDWRNSHLGPAQTAIDTIKTHTDIFGQSMDPGLTGKMGSAGSASDNLHNQHLDPLQQIVKDLNTFVSNFETAMSHWPSSEHTNVNVTGSGSTKISSTVPGVTGGTINLKNFGVGLSSGGVLPGFNPGVDSIPAMLSPGEGVLIPEAVRALGGEKVINDINRMNRVHFADGGVASESALEALTKTGKSTTYWWDKAMGSKNATLHHDAALLTAAMKGMGVKHGSDKAEDDMIYALEGIGKFFPPPAVETAAQKMSRLIGIGEHSGVTKAINDAKVLAGIIGNKKLSSKQQSSEEAAAEAVLEHELHLLHEQHLQHFASGGIALPDVTSWAENTLGNASTTMTDAYQAVITSAINEMKNQATQLALASGPAGGATGSEMANGIELYNYLLTNVFGGHKIAAAGAIASIWGESTWNPFSINCVPLTYKVVTTRGVLTHDEVRVGDQTPVFNPNTGKVENAVILNVPYHYDAQICRLGNNDWSVICTWDHKWITDEGLVRAMDMHPGTKVLLGEGRWEIIEFAWDMGYDDTFCLTTTTGTWTTVTDDGDVIWTGNSDGRGLIGWTPQGTISNAAFEGGMKTQEPAIIAFINSSGDEGVIREMDGATSVLEAANLWGKGVERYGINDVHSEGIALATSIMNSGGNAAPAQGLARAINHAARSTQDAGGWIYPGMNIVDNHTGQIERTVPPGQGPGDGNVLHATFQIDGKSVFEAMAPIAYQKASRQNGNSNASAYWAPGNKR